MASMQYDKSFAIDILDQINVIFEICTEYLSELLTTLKQIKNNLSTKS